MEKEKIGYNVDIQAPTGVGRVVRITFNMEEDAKKEDFDKKFDMLMSAVERQQAIGALPKVLDELKKAQEEIEAGLKVHERLKSEMADLELRANNYKQTHNGHAKTMDAQAFARMQADLDNNWTNLKKQEEGVQLLKQQAADIEALR